LGAWETETTYPTPANRRLASPPFSPAPLKRRPERMNSYSTIILKRMRQVGW
jgi:hypothetical protein